MNLEQILPFLDLRVRVQTKEKEYTGSANRILDQSILELVVVSPTHAGLETKPVQIPFESIENIGPA